MARKNALIRFSVRYKIEPEKLSDTRWAKLYCEAEWYLLYTGQIAPRNG